MYKMRLSAKYPFLLIVLTVLLLGSCEEIIDFRGEQVNPVLVMYALLEPDSLISITLSRSYAIFDNNFRPAQITSARVIVFVDDIASDTLVYVPPDMENTSPQRIRYSRYVSARLKPVYNSIYRIEAKVPGLPPVSASVILPAPVPVERIDTMSVPKEGVNDISPHDYYYNPKLLETKVRFTDKAGEKNFYRLTITYLSGIYGMPREEPFDPAVPVSVYHGDCSYYARADRIITPPGSDNDLIGMEITNTYLIFNDDFIDGTTYDLTFNMEYALTSDEHHEFTHFTISLHAITEDYYKYLSTLAAQQQTNDMPMSEPVLIYSNIKGGLGLVAAQSVSANMIMIGEYPVPGVLYKNY